MLFTTPLPKRIDERRALLAHLVSMEGIPWYCRTTWKDHLLTLERATKESGTLVCPWKIGDRQWTTLSSASLMEREEPYCLPVELCRGMLHRLRERLCAWQSAGYAVSDRCKRLEEESRRQFMKAAMHQSKKTTCDKAVESALQHSYEAIEQLLEDAAPGIAAMRRALAAKVPPFLGGWSGAIALEEKNAINLTCIPVSWAAVADTENSYDWSSVDAAIELAERANRRILLGPLLRWTEQELPEWLADHIKTFEDLSNRISSYVYAVARRYSDRVMVLEVADRVSQPTPLGLEPMQQIQLLADAVRAAANIAPSLPRMVTIGLPFGEPMVARQTELSPLHFADYLLRSESGLSAIGLEIDCGDNLLGYPPRDPLDVAKLFDRWALLGLPLLAFLRVVDGPDLTGDTQRDSSPDRPPRRVDSRPIVDYASQIASVSFANTSVQAVIWRPENPKNGAPALDHGGGVADRFATWKKWLGC